MCSVFRWSWDMAVDDLLPRLRQADAVVVVDTRTGHESPLVGQERLHAMTNPERPADGLVIRVPVSDGTDQLDRIRALVASCAGDGQAT